MTTKHDLKSIYVWSPDWKMLQNCVCCKGHSIAEMPIIEFDSTEIDYFNRLPLCLFSELVSLYYTNRENYNFIILHFLFNLPGGYVRRIKPGQEKRVAITVSLSFSLFFFFKS